MLGDWNSRDGGGDQGMEWEHMKGCTGNCRGKGGMEEEANEAWGLFLVVVGTRTYQKSNILWGRVENCRKGYASEVIAGQKDGEVATAWCSKTVWFHPHRSFASLSPANTDCLSIFFFFEQLLDFIVCSHIHHLILAKTPSKIVFFLYWCFKLKIYFKLLDSN